MSASDDDRDGETTADWEDTPSEQAADDGEATTVVPRMPSQRDAPQVSSPTPPAAAVPPLSMSPPPSGSWDPRWHSAAGPGGFPPTGGGWAPPPVAPGHYPPGYPAAAPAPPAPRKSRWGLLAAGAIALVAIVVAVTVVVTRGGDSSTPPLAQSSTASSASAPSTTATTYPATTSTTADIVRPTALKGLLASAAQVTQVANNVMMTPTGDQASPIIGVQIDPFKCTGAVMTGMYITYIGMGTAFVVQTLNNASPRIDVAQALTSFSSEGDAKKFVDRQFQDWEGCDGTDVTGTSEGRYAGPPQHGRLSKTDNSQGVSVNVLSPLPGAEGRQCQHVMSARDNVVVDVRVCAADVGNMGLHLDQAIGENITGRR